MSSKRSRRSKKRPRPRPTKSSSAGSKARKPKFMSLNDHLGPALARPAETQPMDDNNSQVACLLEESIEPDGRATITDLFGTSTSSSSAVIDEVLSPASPSVDLDGDGLARRVLRGRERWVFCRSEVAAEEAVVQQQLVLQLKLDYEEVMTAWSDRGSLYIDGEGPPQVVPDLGRQQAGHDHGCCFDDDFIAPTVFVGVGNAGGLTVPEMEVEGKEHKLNREERVMRYKAKRQSRLFSKRIRYEVRKLNAEKRPRIKGRFVKRVDDV